MTLLFLLLTLVCVLVSFPHHVTASTVVSHGDTKCKQAPYTVFTGDTTGECVLYATDNNVTLSATMKCDYTQKTAEFALYNTPNCEFEGLIVSFLNASLDTCLLNPLNNLYGGFTLSCSNAFHASSNIILILVLSLAVLLVTS